MGSETKNPPETEALAGKVSGGSNAIMHPERVARLGECKQRSRKMASYLFQVADSLVESAGNSYASAKWGEADKDAPVQIERPMLNLAMDVSTCANYLVFHNYYTVDQIRLAKITTCKKHLLCPVCARIRAAKQVSRYLERLQLIRETTPRIKLALLTLTVKNGPDLDERFSHLVKSWKKYQKQRRDWLSVGRGRNELCNVSGAVFSYEVTNKGNGWHPHLHAVVILDDWISQSQLSDEWLKITGDSHVVDVRRIKKDPAEGFLEVFKYALKFSELDLADNLHAFETLRGKRLQGSFGAFHGVKVPESMTDDLIDDLPYLEMFYQYSKSKGTYDLTDCKSVSPGDHIDSSTELKNSSRQSG